jgi:NAD(P)-dependent dehydrogenase (short-subunit alcohol dehydrogenase family)
MHSCLWHVFRGSANLVVEAEIDQRSGEISMKNVVITGSTKGLGLCMAREFLRLGCNVTLSGRNAGAFATINENLANCKGKYIFVKCDVSDREDIDRLWCESAAQWGRVDIWINNAGRNFPHKFIYDVEQKYVDSLIDANIRGMVYGSQVAAKNMLIQGGGQIWNMEGLGSNDMIQAKTILYGMSKRALTYFTRGLAKELSGTAVMAGRLSPGMMLTDFITKTPDGEASSVVDDVSFRKIFNILADRPEKVAAFLVPSMLKNNRNDAHLVFLSNAKIFLRFASAPFRKRKLI